MCEQVRPARRQGTTDPDVRADLAKGRLRAKIPALRTALTGRFRGHHAFLVTQILAHLDYLDEAIGIVSQEVDTHLAPFADGIRRLDAIPGINARGADVILAELGVDMATFPTDRHLASWAGLCPGQHESAGKSKTGKTRKGNRWLRATSVECALAAIRTKNAPFGARYHHLTVST